jgi:hypothetical protein
VSAGDAVLFENAHRAQKGKTPRQSALFDNRLLLQLRRFCARELPMKAFLLLVTWLASNQPPSHYRVQFSSNETCEAARQQLIKDAERIGQAMIERATAQDRQIGGGNKTSLAMAAIANAPYVSAVCVAE